ncbi:CDP-diacylglycerol--glycerol-3-phosphate 3-phosphatidyltransferase [Candidatus Peribacteria bacterium RIFOXYC2_FULL_55_14]|nr:MAG: CDP-diacylglycerol--glycerol-3-phosphate 3-phosphatidyltransferase [Candidatus Peribacteria bacterium RIFOXYA1_FULL_56_14]OGJ74319.1 MAG: CDP-diacylglycerol--glycerol-3-phosphate 3-phosphatidyltransferase [Candidatus Peribacteria bacterium RIFOXYB1_FULL_54_35]OGJ75146.1 MAG: CDP-diacylglycerol--glycerol-3-phosphate 3-phosphatidyltransferase [Candidatus Peribacteria bacterium RIFOXYA2_FULL_55_28]OGJ75937.1 MAG: CDP-diacylglycerol--glycerol-3-phosphate 3-phosphatidyltransferase [Candidatus
MTLPNKITSLRFLLAAVVVALLLVESVPSRFIWAVVLFVLAASTDFVDGVVARRTQSTSGLGAFLDPLADKLLILPTFVTLVVLDLFPLWLFVLMLVRDLLNDAYRNYAASQRIILKANLASKIKTFFQMLSLTLALAVLVFRHEQAGLVSGAFLDFLFQLANFLMLMAFIIGIVGTVQFMVRHTQIVTGNE